MTAQSTLFAPPVSTGPRLATRPLPAGIHATGRWSPDKAYRYALTWTPIPVRDGPLPLVIGLNPSGASEEAGDATLTRILGFLPGGFTMMNLFALRATEPAELGKSADPIGEETDAWLVEALRTAAFVVAAWGAPPSGPVGLRALVAARVVVVRKALRGRDVRCWGTSRAGHPRHPLYLASDTALVPWVMT